MRLAGQPGKIAAAPHEGLRAEQLFLVLKIIKQASRTQEPETFFRIVVDAVHNEVPAFSHVSIFEMDNSPGQVRAVAVAGDEGTEKTGSAVRRPWGSLAAALRSGAAWVSNDIGEETGGFVTMAPDSRSALCIPIRMGDRVLALLNIESRETDVFSPADVALFEILCEHLADFLQSVRLYDEIRRTNVKIQRMTEICRQVLATQSMASALELAVRSVVDGYGYQCCGVALLSQDRSHLVHEAHHAREPVELRRGDRHEMGQGLIGRVAAFGRTLHCNDLDREGSHVARVPGAKAQLCIPLLAGERLLGVLDISAMESDAFKPEDISLMETLGGLLALAIDKADYLEHTSQTRDYLENLIANAGDGIFVLDPAGVVVRWNLGVERLTGYSADDMRGRAIRYLGSLGVFPRAEDRFSRVMKGERIEGVEEKTRSRQGIELDVVLTMSPIIGPSGALAGVSAIVRDVTERRRLEEGLSAMHGRILESEARFMEVIEKAHDAIFLVDARDSRIIQANLKAEEMTSTSRERLIGRPFLELHPDEERDSAKKQFQETVRTGAGPSVDFHLMDGGGPPRDVEVTSSVLHHGGRSVVQWFCRDISDRRRAEQEKEALHLQLLQSEKLSALGHLISGVAHELNNPLTGVIGYSQLLTGLECDERIRRGLERVYTEARRCHRVVQNLLTFARKHTPEKNYISINDILESTIELRSYQMRVDDIEVRMDLSRDLPRTMGDFHQLQQVFMNLVNNAHQAIQETGSGGTLTIRSSSRGDIIRVEIADTGPGIPAEILKKIFDPFFTTKQPGQGTGLGLSICFGIIEEHEGKILATSTMGEGTTFTIDLPVLRQSQERVPGRRDAGVDAPVRAAARAARLLLVDEAPSAMEPLCEALRKEGHDVETSPNGQLALRKILDGSYDAVITDMELPGLSGQELFTEVRRIHPALSERFVFTVGEAVSDDTQEFLKQPGRLRIVKPFNIGEVVTLVDQILSGIA